MSEHVSTVILLVRPGSSPQRTSELRRWIRALVPAALILVSSVPVDAGAAGGVVVTVCADEIEAGPLAVAAALARARQPVTRTPGESPPGRMDSAGRLS